jgi:valyl-tRNA synthetase
MADITKDIDEYRFYMAAEKIYHYIWDTFADIILEDSKKIFTRSSDAEKDSRKQFLINNLIVILKVLHPFMPFITEEVWQSVPYTQGILIIEDWK